MQQHTRVLAGALTISSFVILASETGAAGQTQPLAAACTWITNIDQLQAMRKNLAGTYCLANDIDASSMANFRPVGVSAAPFTGKLFGNKHVIINLTVNSSADYDSVGLFGYTSGATIQDVGLVNAKVTGKGYSAHVGGLVGQALGTLSRVHVTGQIRCTGVFCRAGGIAGSVSRLSDSWSSAKVTGGGGGSYSYTGGAAGLVGDVDRTHATGPVACGSNCIAGGLAGKLFFSADFSYATGPVTTGESSMAGGLAGQTQESTAIKRSYATGAVATGAQSRAGGLIGQLPGSATVEYSYATGAVMGGSDSMVGGLVGELGGFATTGYAVGPVRAGPSSSVGGLVGLSVGGSAHVINAYWDSETTGQAASAGGTPLTTVLLRAELPAHINCSANCLQVWAITPRLSYPFLNEFDLDFASPLATLVRSTKVFTFLPISQLDAMQYITPPAHAEEAGRAVVHTMIARAIGITQDVAQLKDVKVDRYFWDDAAQTTSWKGPVTTHVTRGTLTGIPSGTPFDGTNVIGHMNKQRLVILRGSYRKQDGSNGTHWMLGTLYARDSAGAISAVVAHDPWTGRQVEIDPSSKTVRVPADFPLSKFKVNGYQPMMVN